MPANLPPHYFDAEKRYRQARTSADKIAALEEMLRIMPKHKGTDKLQADVKARIAKLRRQPARKGPKSGRSYAIPKEGAGQIALVGPANSGKSSLLAALTKARPEVADFPFTTREPLPGMMPYQDIAFQLIDLPPLSQDFNEPWLFDLIRRPDLIWLIVSGSRPLNDLEAVEALLGQKKIAVYPALREPEEELEFDWTRRPALLIATGADRPEVPENVEIFRELLEGRWPVTAVSAVTGQGLMDLGRLSFEALGIIRVYTKQPGKPPDMNQPYTLHQGDDVLDLAAKIHNDLAQKLKHARIWGSVSFDGQTVQRDYVLQDGDVVELRA